MNEPADDSFVRDRLAQFGLPKSDNDLRNGKWFVDYKEMIEAQTVSFRRWGISVKMAREVIEKVTLFMEVSRAPGC